MRSMTLCIRPNTFVRVFFYFRLEVWLAAGIFLNTIVDSKFGWPQVFFKKVDGRTNWDYHLKRKFSRGVGTQGYQ